MTDNPIIPDSDSSAQQENVNNPLVNREFNTDNAVVNVVQEFLQEHDLLIRRDGKWTVLHAIPSGAKSLDSYNTRAEAYRAALAMIIDAVIWETMQDTGDEE